MRNNRTQGMDLFSHLDSCDDVYWKGMPEFSQEDLTDWGAVRISFACQEDMDAFSELIGKKITKATKGFFYPLSKQAKKVWVDEK